jgi:hypothetical protein
LLQKLEGDKDLWHQAPLYGHSLEGIFHLTPEDLRNMERLNVVTVSQLLNEGDNGNLTREINEDLLGELPPNTSVKLRQLISRILCPFKKRGD